MSFVGGAVSTHAEEPAPAISADTLYAAGVSERFAARYDEAVALLSRAAGLEPDNADIRLQLALSFMAQQRLDAAEDELQHALRLAPDYIDIEIALTRIELWTGRRAEAEARATRLLEENPRRKDIVELAEEVHLRSKASLPSQEGAPSGLRFRRFDGSFSYSHLSGGRTPWREVILTSSFAMPDGDAFSIAVEQASRFARKDTYVELRLDGRVAVDIGAYVSMGGTPSADFKPQTAVAAGLLWTLAREFDFLDTIRVVADAKYAVFSTGDVTSLLAGIEAELLGGELHLIARQINVIDETGSYQSGHSVQLRFQASDGLAILSGWAQAPDTSEGRTFETRTLHAAVQVALSDDLLATATFARDELEGLYDRSSGTVALSYRLQSS